MVRRQRPLIQYLGESKLIGRNTLMKINQALDNKIMGHEAIARTHNVPVELVEDTPGYSKEDRPYD